MVPSASSTVEFVGETVLVGAGAGLFCAASTERFGHSAFAGAEVRASEATNAL
jgi:hypothetical protein